MIDERDKINTGNVLNLSKESYKYKKHVAYRIGRAYGSLRVKKFHDVHNSMYRFVCECELCGKEEAYTASYLKNFCQKCKHCRGVKKDDIKDIQQIIPPQGISDEDFDQAKYEFRELNSYLARLESLCFEYANYKSMLGQDDGKDDKYYTARMTIAIHDIVEHKNKIMAMYESKFPGFSARAITDDIVDEFRQLSGINEDLLGPA